MSSATRLRSMVAGCEIMVLWVFAALSGIKSQARVLLRLSPPAASPAETVVGPIPAIVRQNLPGGEKPAVVLPTGLPGRDGLHVVSLGPPPILAPETAADGCEKALFLVYVTSSCIKSVRGKVITPACQPRPNRPVGDCRWLHSQLICRHNYSRRRRAHVGARMLHAHRRGVGGAVSRHGGGDQ